MSWSIDNVLTIGLCLGIGYWAVWWILSLKGGGGAPGPPSRPNVRGGSLPGRGSVPVTGYQVDDSTDPSSPWFEVLGVAETATLEEINAAHHEKLMLNSERVKALGSEFAELAAKRIWLINRAYEAALTQRRQS